MIIAILLAVGWVGGAQSEEPSPSPTPTAAAAGPVTIGVVETVMVATGNGSTVRVPVRVADGHRVQANPASNEFLVPLTLGIEDSDGLVFSPPVYPMSEPYLLEGSDELLFTYAGEFEVVIPVSATEAAEPGDHSVVGELRYQACNSRMCLFPASVRVELEIVVSKSDGPSER